MKKERPAPQLTVELCREERELTLEGEPVLHWTMCRPVLTGTWKGLGKINRIYEEHSRRLEARWGRELYIRACLDLARQREESRPFRPWRAELETRVTFQEGELLSLWQEIREHWGFRRPLALRRGDTWSLAEGAPRTLASFFPQKRRWRREVLDQVAAQAEARLAGGESLLDPDCLSRLSQNFSPENFYLTEKGLEVFFPMYALAPSGEGVPAFSLPRPA